MPSQKFTPYQANFDGEPDQDGKKLSFWRAINLFHQAIASDAGSAQAIVVYSSCSSIRQRFELCQGKVMP